MLVCSLPLSSTEVLICPKSFTKIRANIGDTPLLPDGGHATISIGVAQYRANETAKDFIKRVDAAMYRAKAAGRNQVCRG